ncbi:MAG: Hsp20/alpha crystallin family protein [Anaerolineae bacterium]|jgi:HSP20 family protein
MAMTRWEPFKDLMTLREAMDRLFEDSLVPTGTRWVNARPEMSCELPMDVYTTDEELIITAAVPGVNPEDVEITIEGDTLTIRGELAAPLENVNYIAQERPYGKFTRVVRLNLPLDSERAEATFDKGILTLVIPKKEEIRPKTIQVKSK